MEILKNYLLQKGFLNDKKTDEILQKFSLYFDLLIEWNNKFNLTAITEKNDVQIKHFIDSLLGNSLIEKGANVCDIGSGAGFPSLPLAIIRNDCNFTLVDSLGKRVTFLNEAISQLELSNCTAIHARAEDFAAQNFQKYNVCVARAVAPMQILLEYTLPTIKVGGHLLAYKSIGADDEVDLSQRALKILGGSVDEMREYTLPNGDTRIIVDVQKVRPCPSIYPRGGNKPRLKPL